MTKIACTALGVLAVLAIQGLAVSVIVARAHGWSARAEPSRMEQWMARRARDAAMPAEARNQPNPVPNTAEVLADARAHWADHCASCHAGLKPGVRVVVDVPEGSKDKVAHSVKVGVSGAANSHPEAQK